MQIKVGDRLPSAALKEIGSDGALKDLMTEALFKGRRVALFAVPGAFTRTCSSRHLPGFFHNAAPIRQKGVDDIVCLAVNDAFVMRAWGDAHGAPGKVRMVGDGNASFVRAIGLDKDSSANGMGTRCHRFSMLVDDGVVKSLNIDPPGEFGSTSAETMLAQL